MAISLASINDRAHHRGTVYSTTAKSMSGGIASLAFLAPSWALVGGYKNYLAQGRDPRWLKYAPLSEEQYTRAYWASVMSEGRKQQWNAWIRSVRPEEEITLLCYCAPGQFCHRRIIAEMIREWRADLEVVLY